MDKFVISYNALLIYTIIVSLFSIIVGMIIHFVFFSRKNRIKEMCLKSIQEGLEARFKLTYKTLSYSWYQAVRASIIKEDEIPFFIKNIVDARIKGCTDFHINQLINDLAEEQGLYMHKLDN